MLYTGTFPIQNDFSAFLNTPNFIGQLSVPNLYAPAFMLGNDTNINTAPSDPVQLATDDIQQAVTDTNWFKCFYWGVGCADVDPNKGQSPSFLDRFTGGTGDWTLLPKNFGLLALALLLLAFGLFMLAKSTDTGKAVINIAGKV